LESLGFSPSGFDRLSGMQAGLYYYSKRANYILAFRGSEPPSNFWEFLMDWSTDYEQLSSPTAQYSQAAALSREVREKLNQSGADLIFTGHSLGGGLAQIGAISTNSPAITFNAAGPSAVTLWSTDNKARKGIDDSAITSYYIQGEMVSSLQDQLPGVESALGRRIALEYPGEFPWTQHLMDAVLDAIELKLLKTISQQSTGK
jgi:hypothetical protein